MGENEQLTFPPFVRPSVRGFGPTGRAVVGRRAQFYSPGKFTTTYCGSRLSPLRRSLPRLKGKRQWDRNTTPTDGPTASGPLSFPPSFPRLVVTYHEREAKSDRGRTEREGGSRLTHSQQRGVSRADRRRRRPPSSPPPSFLPRRLAVRSPSSPLCRRCTTHGGGGGATYIIESVLNEEKSFCECAIPHKATKDGPWTEGGRERRPSCSKPIPPAEKRREGRTNDRKNACLAVE